MTCITVVLAGGLLLVPCGLAAQDPPRDAPPAHVVAARQEAELKAVIAAEGLTAPRALALAGYQAMRGALAEAEKTLLDARKLFPTDVEIMRALVSVYDRQADAERDPERKLARVSEAARLRAEISTAMGGPCHPQPELVGGLKPVRVGGNIKAPNKTKDVRPVYPPEAQKARIMGVVVLEVALDASGRVAQLCVLQSTPGLDGAAMHAVRDWEFAPTLLNGAPVPVIMTVTVNFTLE